MSDSFFWDLDLGYLRKKSNERQAAEIFGLLSKIVGSNLLDQRLPKTAEGEILNHRERIGKYFAQCLQTKLKGGYMLVNPYLLPAQLTGVKTPVSLSAPHQILSHRDQTSLGY
jgi:hypothetical protein